MNILDLISTVGIVVSVYTVVFTSKKLTTITEQLSTDYVYILAFVSMHLIFFLKYLLSIFIEDVPEWVSQDEENAMHRRSQTLEDNQDKKLISRLRSKYTPFDLLLEVLNNQH